MMPLGDEGRVQLINKEVWLSVNINKLSGGLEGAGEREREKTKKSGSKLNVHVAPFCLPSKMAKISLRTMDYSPWGSKNRIGSKNSCI